MKLSSGSLESHTDRFGYINSLRGIAALLVIYLHLADHFLHTEPNLGALDRWSFIALTEVIDIGKAAVIVFFAISGYVIPFSLMKRTDHAVQRFVIGRFSGSARPIGCRSRPPSWSSSSPRTSASMRLRSSPT